MPRLDTSLQKLLRNSNHLLVVMTHYVKEYGTPVMSSPLNNNDQYFLVEEVGEKTYYYMEPHHWAKIYDLISENIEINKPLKQYEEGYKNYKNSQLSEKVVECLINYDANSINNSILENMSKDELSIIGRLTTTIICNSLLANRDKQNPWESTRPQIGEAELSILLGMMALNVVYKYHVKEPPLSWIEIKEIKEDNLEEYLKTYFKDKLSALKEENQILYDNINLLLEKNKSIKNWLPMYIVFSTLLDKEQKTPEEFSLELKLEDLMKKEFIHRGQELISILVTKNILTRELQNEVINKRATQTGIIRIAEALEIDIALSASYYKPLLNKECTPSVIRILEEENKVNYTYHVKDRSIRYTHKYQISINKAEKEEILNPFNTAYCINTCMYGDFIQYFSNALQKNNNVYIAGLSEEELRELENFIFVIYGIDFNIIRINASKENIIYVDKLMKFALDFDLSIDNIDLIRSKMLVTLGHETLWHLENTEDKEAKKKAYKHNLYISLFNKILGLKYYLKALLNDLNIYKQFSHFYTPHFLSYTGRKFTSVYTLQLQGHKLSHIFILMKSKNNKLLSKYYEVFITVAKEYLGNYSGNLNKLVSPEDYKKACSKLKYLQAASLLKDKSLLEVLCKEIEADPSINLIERIMKMDLHQIFRKPDKGLMGLLLLSMAHHPRYKNLDMEVIYQKDATSSVIQVIAMLMKDMILAEISNLSGSEYIDIYKEYSIELQKNLNDMMINYGDLSKLFIEGKWKTHFDNWRKTLYKCVISDTKNIKELFYVAKVIMEDLNASSKSLIPKVLLPKYSHISWCIDSNKKLLTNQVLKEIFDKDKKTIKDKDYVKNVFMTMNLVNQIGNVEQLLNDRFFQEVIKDRKIFKTVIMAKPYGQGTAGATETLKERLIEKCFEMGFDKIPSEYTINTIASLISNHLHMWMEKNYPSLSEFASVSNVINPPEEKIEHAEGVIVHTPFYSWIFDPKDSKPERCYLRENKLDPENRTKLTYHINTSKTHLDNFSRSFATI